MRMKRTAGVSSIITAFVSYAGCCSSFLSAQEPALGTPVIAAAAKGPNQINLTWPAVPDPGYGYLVEVQSEGDSRYSSWTELQTMPLAAGYTCDKTILHQGTYCNTSDPSGSQVYNPPTHGVPFWVTEANYSDPQDSSAAQFIVWGLRPNTSYRFRVRCYAGDTSSSYGAYSAIASARTADYALRYVSLVGKDSNDGRGQDASHAWRTLAHATRTIGCGQELIVMPGNYASDTIVMPQHCSGSSKAVVLVNPGDTATITSQPVGAGQALLLSGDYIVIDGLSVASLGAQDGEYDGQIDGSHNALMNVEFHPQVVPSFKWGVIVHGSHNLLYHSYLHDYGSPDPTQNPSGNGGFVVTVLGAGATDNAIWSNHLTRGGHDESLCKSGCSNNRWLNNVMDGGWGQGWIAVYGDGAPSEHNLVEGNVMKGVGQLVPFFKPSIQVSGGNNTVRRNIVIDSKTWALEVSSFSGGTAGNNLIYNNVFYKPGGCYFQSSSRGADAYYNDIFVNNICYRVHGYATDIYQSNPTNRISNNDILAVDAQGRPQPQQSIIIWNHSAGSPFENAVTLSAADKSYAPTFSRNKGLDVTPKFVDEADLDFHLSANSPLIGAGIAITDTQWGSTVGTIDPGAFGIGESADFGSLITKEGHTPDRGLDAAAALALAGDYQAALEALRTRPGAPHGKVIEAALLRAAGDDAGAAEVLARLQPLDPGDFVARFELVRQGKPDTALGSFLSADAERVLEIADLYTHWGLFRDVLEVLLHNPPQPPGSRASSELPLSHPLVAYYRAFCRERLGYDFYSSDDLRAASTLPVRDVAVRTGTLALLQWAIQRNPTDPNATYLLGLLFLDAGRTAAARFEFQNSLKLRPAFAEASAMLTKLGAAPSVPKFRPAERPTGTAPTAGSTVPAATSAVPTPGSNGISPRAVADMALTAAVSGDLGRAINYFTASNFPKDKQEDAVRETYIELQLQRLLVLAEAKQCGAVDQGITTLGYDDKRLPFTFSGFGTFMKGLRFQYQLGVIEAACVDEKAARKRWEKVAKGSPDLVSPDFAYPYLALGKLNPEDGPGKAKNALGLIKSALATDKHDARDGALFFSEGQLELILGKKTDAAASFRAGAEISSPGMIQYLNLDALRRMGNEQ